MHECLLDARGILNKPACLPSAHLVACSQNEIVKSSASCEAGLGILQVVCHYSRFGNSLLFEIGSCRKSWKLFFC